MTCREVGAVCSMGTGIDVNKMDRELDREGHTAIMSAAVFGHPQVVRVLLAVPGIDLNKETTSGTLTGLTELGPCDDKRRR